MFAGCGQVRFIDPDADLKASLRIKSAQRLHIDGDPRDYYHIRIGARERLDLVSFSVSGGTALVRLPMEEAQVQNCGDTESCYSFTLAPGIPRDVDHVALEASAIAHRHETGLDVVELNGYQLAGLALMQNSIANVTIDDPIRRFYGTGEVARVIENGDVKSETPILLFPRAFDAVSARGGCGLPATNSEGEWKEINENPFNVPAIFNNGADPETCISVRPRLPREGNGVIAVSIPARAVITRFVHMYVPPVEISPLVAIILFDLEIPNEERCSAAQTLLRSAVLDGMTEIAGNQVEGAETLLLDSVQIATEGGSLCHQSEERSFDPSEVARQLRNAINDHFGADSRVRAVVIYAANLDLDLPVEMVNAFQVLRSELDAGTPDRAGMLLGIGAQGPVQAIGPDRTSPWLASEEPAFRESIKGLLSTVWPFRTVLHTDQTIVPLLSMEERERFHAYRVCASDPQVTAIGVQRPDTTVIQVGPFGPAYQVRLTPQILVDNTTFMVPSVTVDWEACTDLCDHATPDGDPTIPWERTNACMEQQ